MTSAIPQERLELLEGRQQSEEAYLSSLQELQARRPPARAHCGCPPRALPPLPACSTYQE